MLNINREQFKIDLVLTGIQTVASLAATQIFGSLGQYRIRPQTAVLISSLTHTVALLANNIFNKTYSYYAALPFGIIGGLAAHKFFYPNVAIQQVLDVKGLLIITITLASVKLFIDNFSHLKRKVNEKKEVTEPVKHEEIEPAKDAIPEAPAVGS